MRDKNGHPTFLLSALERKHAHYDTVNLSEKKTNNP